MSTVPPIKHREVLKRFLALEGLDGAGTTTQSRLFAERCLREGVPCFTTSEPTDGECGRLCRHYLRGLSQTHARTLAYLFAADRNDHLENPVSGIRTRLDAGDIVMCDRYLFSSLAYQSVECGFDFVFTLNEPFPLPEIVVYLDVSVEEGARRLASRSDKEIFDALSYQEAVKERYELALSVFEGTTMQVLRIDADLPQIQIAEQIWSFAASTRTAVDR